jgi:hypothetical protein
MIFHIFSRYFTPFFSCKGLVFRRLGKIPGYKRCRGQKMKYENIKVGVFMGRRGGAESMKSEIFQMGASAPASAGAPAFTRFRRDKAARGAESDGQRTVPDNNGR